MSEFREGDRVRLDDSDTGSWKQPFKRFSEEKRLATVTRIWPRERAHCRFDVKRAGAMPESVPVRFKHLILVERAPATDRSDGDVRVEPTHRMPLPDPPK